MARNQSDDASARVMAFIGGCWRSLRSYCGNSVAGIAQPGSKLTSADVPDFVLIWDFVATWADYACWGRNDELCHGTELYDMRISASSLTSVFTPSCFAFLRRTMVYWREIKSHSLRWDLSYIYYFRARYFICLRKKPTVRIDGSACTGKFPLPELLKYGVLLLGGFLA